MTRASFGPQVTTPMSKHILPEIQCLFPPHSFFFFPPPLMDGWGRLPSSSFLKRGSNWRATFWGKTQCLPALTPRYNSAFATPTPSSSSSSLPPHSPAETAWPVAPLASDSLPNLLCSTSPGKKRRREGGREGKSNCSPHCMSAAQAKHSLFHANSPPSPPPPKQGASARFLWGESQ